MSGGSTPTVLELIWPATAQFDLRHFRLRGIRHFMATAHGQSGTPVATISARLGRRAKVRPVNIYSHGIPPG